MNATVTNTKKEFTPFVLNIEVQSRRELEYLIAIFNASNSQMRDWANESNQFAFSEFKAAEMNGFDTQKVFQILKAKLSN